MRKKWFLWDEFCVFWHNFYKWPIAISSVVDTVSGFPNNECLLRIFQIKSQEGCLDRKSYQNCFRNSNLLNQLIQNVYQMTEKLAEKSPETAFFSAWWIIWGRFLWSLANDRSASIFNLEIYVLRALRKVFKYPAEYLSVILHGN